MKEYSVVELEKLPDLSLGHISSYINVPKGYVCKIGGSFEPHVLFNPDTKHVLVYSYWESSCYGVSASDLQFNGHYSEVMAYTAPEK